MVERCSNESVEQPLELYQFPLINMNHYHSRVSKSQCHY